MKNNIVITGANRGIGLALANVFSKQGDNVYALCRTSSTELAALPVNIIENIDVAKPEGLAHMVAQLKSVSIDILVCNAGILRDESLADFNNQTIREQFEINALAPMNVVVALQSQFSTTAKVAMITSRMGSITDNTSGGRYGYRMSKAALNIAAVSLASDLKPKGVAVGVYHPGYVQTDMVNHSGDISSNDCAERLVHLINGLTLAETGVFKHANGEVLPW